MHSVLESCNYAGGCIKQSIVSTMSVVSFKDLGIISIMFFVKTYLANSTPVSIVFSNYRRHKS